MLKKSIKTAAVCVGTFFLTIASLWLLLVLTALIPNTAIEENMKKSAMLYNGAEAFPYTSGQTTVTDNYADVILLNVLWNIKSDDPLVSSLDTKYYDGNDGTEDYGENYGLYAAVYEGAEPNTDYSRYWHGSVAFIRPLLLITDSDGVKLIGFAAAAVIFLLDCIYLVKRHYRFAAAALVIAFAAVTMQNIRLSLEYQPAVLVCLVILPFFIHFEKKGDTALLILSVISGAAVAFFDFLTTETLTILIPLITVMIIRKYDNRFEGEKKEIILSVKCLAAWLCSYVGAFISKWTAASIATGENKFTAAISSAEVRIYGEAAEMSTASQMVFAPVANISAIFNSGDRIDALRTILGVFLIAAFAVGLYFILRNVSRDRSKDFAILMLMLGIIPYLRYIALNNHSYLHSFFTYRAQAASIMALAAVIWSSTLEKASSAGNDKRVKRRKRS